MIWATGQELQGGKYIIQEVLGHGGFGITYKALALLEGSMKCPRCESVRLRKKGRSKGKQRYQCCDCSRQFVNSKALPLLPDQQVVIKTPHEYLKNRSDYNKFVEQFLKEGERLSQLSAKPHPYIVRFSDLFQEGESHCLVMDFVPGENLFELVRRKQALREAEATRYIRQIGEALVVVHQAGLVHRDAHPGNIIVHCDNRAVLIDFGIAKEQIPSTLSSTGNVGNRGFAPYEQMENGSREPTVDIYALAATLYYVVTGGCPPSSLDRKCFNAALTPPKQIIPSISDRLNQAIVQGMALEAQNRPQSMQEWMKLLEAPKVIIPSPVASAYKQPPSVAPAYKREVVRPPASPAYEQEVVRPPASPAYEQEVVYPSSEKSGTREPEESNPQGSQPIEPNTPWLKNIPWVWLVGALLAYACIGYTLTAFLAPLGSIAVIMAVAVALVAAEAESWAWIRYDLGPEIWSWVGAFALSGVGAWVGIVTWAGAWALFGALLWACILPSTVAWTGRKLRLKSFSKLHTCLILVGTCSLGLLSGWLVFLIVQWLLNTTLM